MESLHQLVRADGARIAYRRWHAPQSAATSPLLLIHGAASNMTRWSEFVAQTRLRTDHDLLRLDLRGHAQSRYRGRIGLEIWSDDIAAILEQEGVNQAVIAGHCLGANIAAMFASRHPLRTSGLILLEPILQQALLGPLRKVQAYWPLFKAVIFGIRALNTLGIYRRHLDDLDLRALDLVFRAHLAEPGGESALTKRYASPLQDLKIMPSANFLQDLVEVTRKLPLSKISTTVLALLSTGRTFADPEITQRVLTQLPNADIQTLVSKHWIPTEQPMAMQMAIETWFQHHKL